MDLPMLSEPVCPAARPVAGTCVAECGVVCVVMQRDHESDAGLGMSAAASGFVQHEATGGVYLNLQTDPNTVTKFCHGDAVPVLDDDDVDGGRASYTYCPTWQAEKERIFEGRDSLLGEPERESIASGVTVNAVEDPWAAARDLELLAS